MPIPAYCAWLRSSVPGQSVDACIGYLQDQQYRPAVIRIYLRGIAHFARWITKRSVPLRFIAESVTHQFLTEHLPACRCPYPCLRTFIAVRAALVHLLHVLRTEGYISEREVSIHRPIRNELELFDNYLGSVCGLAIATRASRRQWVSRFLTAFFAFAPIDIGSIQPHDIVGFMARPRHHYRPGSLGVRCGATCVSVQ